MNKDNKQFKKEDIYGDVKVVQNHNNEWGVLDGNDNVIVPFGKYAWIDGFDNGLSRVRNMRFKWGIINELGEEVLPLEYEKIWNFVGKGRYSTKCIKNAKEENVFFCDLNPELPVVPGSKAYREDDYDDYKEDDYDSGYECHYGMYAGSYAQDVEGYSDEDIGYAFDGDPDAYWNID